MIEQAKKDIEEIKENNDRVIDIINVDSDYKEHSFIDFTFNVSKHDMTNMFTYGYKQIKHHIQRSSWNAHISGQPNLKESSTSGAFQ